MHQEVPQTEQNEKGGGTPQNPNSMEIGFEQYVRGVLTFVILHSRFALMLLSMNNAVSVSHFKIILYLFSLRYWHSNKIIKNLPVINIARLHFVARLLG